ncbi:MAG: PDZ domain-containing protein [Planctomycetes bacterium]|nr:PDZ domain-containing protein [Planctomycetota bacterium]
MLIASGLALLLCNTAIASETEPNQKEEDAIRAAVARVAPSVVRIQTVGGLKAVEGVPQSGGAATGLIVSPEGLIVSSAYNFANRPTAILVQIGDRKNVPARLVATDQSRAIVLLKVDVEPDTKLIIPEAAPTQTVSPGDWAIAVGWTIDPQQVNVSVGIVSAVNRIWGKAIQTDAKVSPANYGGPLIDIHGRVLGVLVPMSPMDAAETAGAEWYDSGIGFAIPLADIFKMLPELAKGRDLHIGLMGLALKGKDLFAQPPVIAACRPGTPAYEAGLRSGDRIVAVGGKVVSNQAQMRHIVGPLYNGNRVRLTVQRGEKQIDAEFALVDKLPPFKQAMLGVLPMRAAGEKPGVPVRFVLPNGAAAQAGLLAGDRIEKIDGREVKDSSAAREILDTLAPEQKVDVIVRRKDKQVTLSVQLTGMTETIPAELPPSSSIAAAKEKPAAGAVINVKIPELANACFAYVPPHGEPAAALGLLVELSPPGKFDQDRTVAQWKQYCDTTGTILLMPRSRDAEKWQADELELIVRAAGQLAEKYDIDATRIAAVGRQGGGAMALLAAFGRLGMFQGVAAIDAALPASIQPPAVEPPNRLAVLVAHAAQGPAAASLGRQVPRLRELGYPVTELTLERVGGTLDGSQQQALSRWLDSLDRF